jgi:hypothetical protein
LVPGASANCSRLAERGVSIAGAAAVLDNRCAIGKI